MLNWKKGREPDRYNNDVDWDVIKALKALGMRLIKDNSIERGPLKTISNKRIYADNMFAFNQTTSHQKNMKAALGRFLPTSAIEYPTDTLGHIEKHMSDPHTKGLMRDNGWLDAQDEPIEIEYLINIQGFRHDGSSVDYLSETGGAIYIGDSHTMAVGLPLKESWTYKAHYNCELTKDLRYINMGMPGYGVDSYYRILKRYIYEIKPNLVVMSYPWHATRTEQWDLNNNCWQMQSINKLGRRRLEEQNSEATIEYFHTATSYIRWYKALDAIKWLCHDVGAKLYAIEEDMNDVDDDLQLINNKYVHQVHENDFARDLVHYGRETHNHNAEVLTEALNYIMR
jgi:hypothetical protein